MYLVLHLKCFVYCLSGVFFHMIIHHISLVLMNAPTNRCIHKLILLNDTWHINWGLKVGTGISSSFTTITMTECVRSHEIVKVSVCEDSQSPRSQLSKQDFSVNWTCSVFQSWESLLERRQKVFKVKEKKKSSWRRNLIWISVFLWFRIGGFTRMLLFVLCWQCLLNTHIWGILFRLNHKPYICLK